MEETEREGERVGESSLVDHVQKILVGGRIIVIIVINTITISIIVINTTVTAEDHGGNCVLASFAGALRADGWLDGTGVVDGYDPAIGLEVVWHGRERLPVVHATTDRGRFALVR